MQTTQIIHFVEHELLLYPQSRLIDLYKNLFQDAFGPGHLINDRAKAEEYLQWELAQQDYCDTKALHVLGMENEFYRVNLLLIKQGIVSIDQMIDGMQRSALLARNPTIAQWRVEWERVAAIILQLAPTLPHYEADLAFIQNLLDSHKVMLHHSAHYVENYHPHYRVIHKTIVEEWGILSKIN